ncbi:Adenylate cyclase (EC [Olavius sp. associated proteobacterium Delta 1]|nr:Adenylate cyclase (EC [Olavius sp. associated proteobacterium Delta 1]
MIGKLVSHYKILEKLGEGGTGVVYKALDGKLNRIVALKFFHDQPFTNEDQKAFLTREAQAAAALNHPNIRTIYEIDETDEYFFLSMAFIEGASLKKNLIDGPLNIETAISIAYQVADGLEVAHKNSIIHRNLNSANILITDRGLAKILNFGLPPPTVRTEMTSSSKFVNTTAYLSPELLRSEEVDQRTDVWSWGVVLYEMLTGKLPFKGESQENVIHAILNDEPPLPSKMNIEIPVKLERLITRAMAKSLQDRHQNISEIMVELQTFEISPQITGQLEDHSDQTQPSIAVLAFEDMSPAKDQEYFCDGIAEEIINDLAQVGGLHVASRTSSFAYKGMREDIRNIGKKLGVRSVLEGSVRRTDGRLRITTQLISVADGYHLWTGQYDREIENVFAIQEEIANSIALALKVELTDEEKHAIEKTSTRSIEAYDFYLRGRRFFYRHKRKYTHHAIEMFARAIEKDSSYARAYAGKADCHSYLFWYFGGSTADLEQAEKDSQTALKLDPNLSEAHAARGLALSLSKRFEEAEKEFETAIELNLNLFEAYYFYARACFVQGRYEEAKDLYLKASRVNPADYQSPALLAFLYKTMGQEEKMEPVLHEALDKVEQHLALNPDDSRAIYLGADVLIRLGEKPKAMEYVKRLAATERDEPYLLYGIACLYSLIGKPEEAVYYLTKSVEVGFAHRQYLEKDSDFDAIRDHPSYKALIIDLKAREKDSGSI